MPLWEWTINKIPYNLDYLLYGHWDLRRLTYEYSFLLFYDKYPEAVFDPNENGGLGTYTIDGVDVNSGQAIKGYGTADPRFAQIAGDTLVEVGGKLSEFQDKVLKGNEAELDKQWRGPAHEALKRVLKAFDNWVTDVLQVTRNGHPNGRGAYDSPTYELASAHRKAQKDHLHWAREYRAYWEEHVWAEWHAINNEQKKRWWWGYEFPVHQWNFDHATFAKWLRSRRAPYRQRIDAEVLGPVKSEFGAIHTTQSRTYEGLIPRYLPVDTSPYFEPAPTPEKKKDDDKIKIDIEGYDPPKYEAPKYDPPKFDPPKFDPPNFDPPTFDQSNFDPSSMDQPNLDSSGFGEPGFGEPGFGPPPTDLLGGNGGLGPDGLPIGSPGGDPSGGPGGMPGGLVGSGGAGLGSGGGLGRGKDVVTGPDGRQGFDVTGDGKPDLGLDGKALADSGLPPGSKLVTGPDGTEGVDIDGDGIPDVGMDGRALPEGSLPAGTRLVTGPDGQTGLDVTGDGVPDLGLDGQPLSGGGLPPGSDVVTGPDGRQGIDLDGDGIPDIGFDGRALPEGSLPEGTRLVTGPDGTTGFDVTGDGIPDFGVNGEWLPNSTFFDHPAAPGVDSQIVRPPDDLRGSPGALQTAGGPVAGGGMPMMPMMPMMGGMGGMGGGGGAGGQGQNNERERQTWLLEEDKVWKGDECEPTAVLGRPTDEDEEPAPDEWEAPVKTRPGRGKPGPARPGQRPQVGGWPQSKANR